MTSDTLAVDTLAVDTVAAEATTPGFLFDCRAGSSGGFDESADDAAGWVDFSPTCPDLLAISDPMGNEADVSVVGADRRLGEDMTRDGTRSTGISIKIVSRVISGTSTGGACVRRAKTSTTKGSIRITVVGLISFARLCTGDSERTIIPSQWRS
ncbi:hypothetical protein [Stieleria varia]|uniref:hypothetical protein n=1 Tax=Stieleria varia TaxID=2528005 RepID=UPI0011B78DBC|nr:hypothetical protein [Stieleria varia]